MHFFQQKFCGENIEPDIKGDLVTRNVGAWLSYHSVWLSGRNDTSVLSQPSSV